MRSLANIRGLQLECARGQHEALIVPLLLHGKEGAERSTVRAVHVDNIRGLLGIRRMNGVPDARIKRFAFIAKGLI